VSDDKAELVQASPSELVGEPPVVARLVVEIRSDGSRTIARGAMEDVTSGQRMTLEARGDSPIQLAIALARSLTQLPRLGARSAIRGLLGKRRDR
jgi:serine kinase of HPr protein (carbohydrate metabolism regulator)